jgi:uncharacterized protein (TIGR02680 family)
MTIVELHPAATEVGTVRWIPFRAGILNVWRYYDEVFQFAEGRLLLRGQNGSGKSKALELLLPFLFDANLRANRLSTFGTGERTMHWNLMGEGASGTTRVGYVWLEFRLTGEDDQWFSCGARLQASSHTTTVHADYFTTGLRIGTVDGIELTNEAGQPLTRRALEERLGEHGKVHGNAGEYRSEIRSVLFPGLSEQRYDALITALLQLRTPKLSQRLDPALLSTLLSRALPPLDEQEVAELAEGFERLDRQRERLAALEEEVAATNTLADRQRTYARRVLRASAAALITATTHLDNVTKEARRSAEEYETATAQRDQEETRAERLAQDIDETDARITGFVESEAYKQGRELDRLRQDTAAAKEQAASIRTDAARKREEADADQAAAHDARLLADQQAANVQAQETETRHAAARAGLISVHEELAADLGGRPRPLLRAAVRSRRDQLSTVENALDDHDRAVDRRQQAESDLEEARETLSTSQAAHQAALDRYELAVSRLGTRLADWIANCRELVFADPEALLDLVESEAALREAVDSAVSAVSHEITRQETLTEARLTSTRAERDDLAAEVVRLTAEKDLPPAAPPTRTTDRGRMAGAPLWQLVDFVESTSDSARASIEAALQAAGLLDAWIGPRGEVEGHDIFADPEALAPVPGRSLADVLVPEQDAPVERLLASIAYDERLPAASPAAIGADGSWRMGNLTGTWSKDQPAYVGALARQRARARRITELEAEIDLRDDRITVQENELTSLRARRAMVAHERATRPDHDEVREAAAVVTRAESDMDSADRNVRRRVAIVQERERGVAQTLHALSDVAAEHGVPTDRTALAKLAAAIDTFSDQAELWLDGHDGMSAARRNADTLAAQAKRSGDNASQREGEATGAESRHHRLAAKLDAVEGTIGVDYREVLAELEQARATLGDLRLRLRTAEREINRLTERIGELRIRRESDAEAREGATTARDTAAQRFRHLVTGELPADAGIELELQVSEGVRATLEAARLVASTWPTIPHAPNNLGDALHRLSESVHTYRGTLSSRADLDLETDEDIQVFTALVDGIRVGAAELLRILRAEAKQSSDEITKHERELFDKTLTGDTRRHLAARIRQANELVDGMNARLERVRTASKVAVRLVWQVAPDLPAGTKAARDLLLVDPVRLSDTERESLHQFFRDRIEQAKAEDTAASWEQQLAQVFDYTSWHRFVVKVDRANGAGWQLLTKKLHGALSGGEKAIALHLPLFAAVAAHYQAVPRAPRVILLDEVFVGVDSDNRGQVFALLSALDLDLMLTSDHEWCTYAELSGISIHQLITGSDGDDAVTTARFTWNGRKLLPQ